MPVQSRRQPTVIRSGWLLPVNPVFDVIADGAVRIVDGKIDFVGRYRDLEIRDADVVHEFPRHAMMPGIVNAHTHVASCLFRGLTEDHPSGFYGLALPMEPHLDESRVRALSRLGIVDVMLSGSTLIQDMYHHASATANAASELGVRAQIAHKTFAADLSGIGEGRWTEMPGEGERRLAENIALHHRWHGADNGRIEVRFSIHAADTCPPSLIEQILSESRRRDAGIHIHAAQTSQEVAHMRETYGMGSIEFLHANDVLGPRTVLAHAVFVDDAEIGILADTETGVAHCPAIYAKRGRSAPVKRMHERGVRIGWGTDWVSMDPWDNARFGIAVTRAVEADVNLLSAREAMWRMTQGAADIVGLGDIVGSLSPGKCADLILIDTDQPHLSPMYDPPSVLIYNASGRDVTHVMVDGEFVVWERDPLRGEISDIMTEARSAAEEVWQAAGLPAEPAQGLRPRAVWPTSP